MDRPRACCGGTENRKDVSGLLLVHEDQLGTAVRGTDAALD